MQNIPAVILAAGKGTRMMSSVPKVMLPLNGKPILQWTIEKLYELGFVNIYINILEADKITSAFINRCFPNVNIIYEKEGRGTAKSLQTSLSLVENSKNILVLYGDDSALYKPETISKLLSEHINNHNIATVITMKTEEPNSVGGLDLTPNGEIIGVMTKSELESKAVKNPVVLCGAFAFSTDWLIRNIIDIAPSLTSGEYPLTGLIKIAYAQGNPISTYPLTNNNEWNSVNTSEELKEAEKKQQTLYDRTNN